MKPRDEVTTAVIAAAGSATRMWPASKVIPKELFPLGRFPVIVHLIAELARAGIRTVVLVVAPQTIDLVRRLFDRSLPAPPKTGDDELVRQFDELLLRIHIRIVPQTGGYGNATPLIAAADYIEGRPCIYAFGDDIVFGENVTEGLMNTYHETGLPVLAAQEVDTARKSSFGILEGRRAGGVFMVSRLLEKPHPDDTPSRLASFGRYLVTGELLGTLLKIRPGRDGELWFVDSVIQQLHEGKKVCAFPLTTGTWYTVGDPISYAAAVSAAAQVPDALALPPRPKLARKAPQTDDPL